MSSASQNGLIPLVDGQQSYDITFSPAFQGLPSFIDGTVQMPNSSGEIFEVNVARDTLTRSGVTVWLSGVPSAASVGGYINWYALGPFAAPTSPTVDGGMTTVQLFHRIARRARGGDFTKLSMTEQTDLAEAANAALQRLYNALPTYFKEQTQGFVLRGPISITGIGVTKYARTVTAHAFSSDQFGQTVVLDGDAGWNQIIGEDELLNPYMGETGTVNATIYGNALHSTTYPLDRIIGNPKFANQGQAPFFNSEIVTVGAQAQGQWLWQQSVGVPQVCWPQVFGNSQGKSPIMVLRFAPAPGQDYAVNVRIGFWPKRLTLADYDAATTLVVPPQFVDSALIPMCLQEFMSSPAWQVRGDELAIDARGERGELFAKNQPGTITNATNRLYTPPGF